MTAFYVTALFMGASSATAKSLFYQGEYKKLFDLTVDAKAWKKNDNDLSYVIGALAFAGRMEEAEILAAMVFAKKDLSAKIRTRFFLGLGFTRLSEYRKALSIFAENYKLALKPSRSRNGSLNPVDRFYIFQGVSFYRYYCGRFSAAKRASDVSFEAAFEGDYLYGKALATDIRSHILIGLGETSSGFALRKKAIQFLRLLGHKSLITAFQITTITDRARLGFTPAKSLEDLLEAVTRLKPDDNYSRANLLLELSRQWTLRGRVKEAWEILDQASEVIYAFQNRRQEATLNLRYGYLLYCSGEYSRALNSIRSATRTLHQKVDLVLERERLGLELKLVKALNMTQHAEKLQQDLLSRSMKEANLIHRRILLREQGEFNLVRKGMDPLGDLMDLVRTSPQEAIEPILEAQYLQLFYEVLKIPRTASALFLDLKPGLVLTFQKGEVIAVEGLTSLLRKVLKALSQGITSKENIFHTAWGFSYDPLRHDTVIYAAINSLRKLLGPKAYWIETIENGYRLSPEVAITFHRANEGTIKTENSMSVEEYTASLNYRQIEILGHLARAKFIDVQECKQLFDVSDITASRDLSALTAAGHVIRVGRGRATKYSRQFKTGVNS